MERALPMSETPPMSDKPIRVQLRRTKGWRMPANTVKVTRGPGMKWGNPFKVGEEFARLYVAANYGPPPPDMDPARIAVIAFGMWIANGPDHFLNMVMPKPPSMDEIKRELGGKNLACWCEANKPYCHGDALLNAANGGYIVDAMTGRPICEPVDPSHD